MAPFTKFAAPVYRERVEVYGITPGKQILGGFYPQDGGFATFGGGIDPDESPTVAGPREYREEAFRRIRNPQLAPIEPFTASWETLKNTSAKLRQRQKNYTGSRTHYVVGNLGRPVNKPSTDPHYAFSDVKLRPITEVINAQKQAIEKAKTKIDKERLSRRLAVLEYLDQKTAAEHREVRVTNFYQKGRMAALTKLGCVTIT